MIVVLCIGRLVQHNIILSKQGRMIKFGTCESLYTSIVSLLKKANKSINSEQETKKKEKKC